MDPISETRLSQVNPVLADKIRLMHEQLDQEGIEIRVVQGLRSVGEQNSLYAQGRTTPGEIVTNCKGGYSYHNFGMAVDCVPSTHGPGLPFDPDWNETHTVWQRMTTVGESLGLNCGATWRTFKDYPHFQLTGCFQVGHPPDKVRRIFVTGGNLAVWKASGIIKDEVNG